MLPHDWPSRLQRVAQKQHNRDRQQQQAYRDSFIPARFSEESGRSCSRKPKRRENRGPAMTVKDWASSFWITLLDEGGETFYANPTTGERKWDLPVGSLVLPRSAEGEWYELWSDEHRLPYYFHTTTNETRWYKPDGFVIPLKAVQRFSKGKRFSLLSIDSASIGVPDAPEPTYPKDGQASTIVMPESDSFEDLAKRSLELDESDPLAAALLQCMVQNTIQLSQNLNSSVSSSKTASSGRTVFSDASAGDTLLRVDEQEAGDTSFASRMLINSSTQDSLAAHLSHAIVHSPCGAMHSSPESSASTAANFKSFGTDGSLASAATLSSPIGGPSPLSRSYSSATGTLESPVSPLISRRIPGTPLSPRFAGYGHTTQDSQGTLGRSELAYAGISFDEVEHESFDEQLQFSPSGITKQVETSHADSAVGVSADVPSPKIGQAEKSKFATAKNLFTAPLTIRKRKSKIGLGEAFEPVVPMSPTIASAPATMPSSPNLALSPSSGPSSPSAFLSRSTTSRLTGLFGKGLSDPSSPPRILDLVDAPSHTNHTLHDLDLPDPAFIEEARKRKFSQPCPPSPTTTDAVDKGCISPKQTWSRAFSRRAVSAEVASPAAKALPAVSAQSSPPASPLVSRASRGGAHSNILTQYAEQHFGQRKKPGLFGKQMTPQEMARWQADDLETPFLNLPKALRWDALQCFTHLQHVMGDRVRSDSTIRISLEDADVPSPWDQSTVMEAHRILSLGIEAGPNLRDEIFVQLLCQLTENPSSISVYRGWQFVQVLLATFPPSPELEPTLRRFLRARKDSLSGFVSTDAENMGANRSRLAIIAKFALMKLDQIIVKGPRGKVPTHFEIQAASEAAFQPSVFGESLQRIMSLQVEAYPDAKIPIILPFLADGIIALGGLRIPGIFRASGDLEKVNQLRILIDQGKYSFTNGFEDPSVAASLLKLWLRELMHPLIPLDVHADCLEAANDEKRALEIVQGLPSLNRRIITFLVSFLQIFTQDAVFKATNMSASALAMIFTPTLFRPSPPHLVNGATIGKGPAISGPASTTKAISTVFDHALKEQKFLLLLLTYLDANRMEDEDDWVPTHGKSVSLASSKYSTAYASSAGSSRDSLKASSSSVTSQNDVYASSPESIPASRKADGDKGSGKEGQPIFRLVSANAIAISTASVAVAKRPILDRTASSSSASSASSDEHSASGDSGFSVDHRSLGSTRRRHKDRPRSRQPTAPAVASSHSAKSRRSRTRTEVSDDTASSRYASGSESGGSSTDAITSPEIPQKSRLRHVSEPSKPSSNGSMMRKGESVPAIPKLIKPRIVVDEAD